jgi:hypothetical protein
VSAVKLAHDMLLVSQVCITLWADERAAVHVCEAATQLACLVVAELGSCLC